MNRRNVVNKHPYFVEYCVNPSAWQQQIMDNNPIVGYVPIDVPPVVVAAQERENSYSYAFVGETLTSTPTATPGTHDVFHTPQSEESLYQCTLNEAACDVDPEFFDLDEKSSYPIDVDDYQCTLNKASFDVDTEFIDLDGFFENVELKLVPSCSRIIVGDDGVAVLERDISNLRGKQAIGLAGISENVDPKLIPSCSRDVVGDGEVGVLERDVSNLRGKKAKVIQEAASAADAIVIGEGSRILENSHYVVGDDEVGVLERDISNLRGKKAKVVPEASSGADATVVGEGSRILVENSVIGEGSRMPKEDNIKSLFDILKVLAEDSNDDDDDDDDGGGGGGGGGSSIGLLKAFMKAGMTFPRPRW